MPRDSKVFISRMHSFLFSRVRKRVPGNKQDSLKREDGKGWMSHSPLFNLMIFRSMIKHFGLTHEF